MNLLGVIIGIVVFLIGLVICFYGAAWSKYVIFFIAFAAMFYLMNHILADAGMKENPRITVSAIVGIVVGLLCIFGYNWGPWLLGGAFGVLFALNCDIFGFGGRNGNEFLFYIYVIGMAVLFGILCHFFADIMMKIITGLSGGVFIVGSCVYVVKAFQDKAGNIVDYFQGLFNHVFSNGSSTGLAIACIIVGVLGILVQFGIIPNPLHR